MAIKKKSLTSGLKTAKRSPSSLKSARSSADVAKHDTPAQKAEVTPVKVPLSMRLSRLMKS